MFVDWLEDISRQWNSWRWSDIEQYPRWCETWNQEEGWRFTKHDMSHVRRGWCFDGGHELKLEVHPVLNLAGKNSISAWIPAQRHFRHRKWHQFKRKLPLKIKGCKNSPRQNALPLHHQRADKLRENTVSNRATTRAFQRRLRIYCIDMSNVREVYNLSRVRKKW